MSLLIWFWAQPAPLPRPLHSERERTSQWLCEAEMCHHTWPRDTRTQPVRVSRSQFRADPRHRRTAGPYLARALTPYGTGRTKSLSYLADRGWLHLRLMLSPKPQGSRLHAHRSTSPGTRVHSWTCLKEENCLKPPPQDPYHEHHFSCDGPIPTHSSQVSKWTKSLLLKFLYMQFHRKNSPTNLEFHSMMDLYIYVYIYMYFYL